MQSLNIYYLDIFKKYLPTSVTEKRCQYLKNNIFASITWSSINFFSRRDIQTYSVGFGKYKESGSWAFVCIEII